MSDQELSIGINVEGRASNLDQISSSIDQQTAQVAAAMQQMLQAGEQGITKMTSDSIAGFQRMLAAQKQMEDESTAITKAANEQRLAVAAATRTALQSSDGSKGEIRGIRSAQSEQNKQIAQQEFNDLAALKQRELSLSNDMRSAMLASTREAAQAEADIKSNAFLKSQVAREDSLAKERVAIKEQTVFTKEQIEEETSTRVAALVKGAGAREENLARERAMREGSQARELADMEAVAAKLFEWDQEEFQHKFDALERIRLANIEADRVQLESRNKTIAGLRELAEADTNERIEDSRRVTSAILNNLADEKVNRVVMTDLVGKHAQEESQIIFEAAEAQRTARETALRMTLALTEELRAQEAADAEKETEARIQESQRITAAILNNIADEKVNRHVMAEWNINLIGEELTAQREADAKRSTERARLTAEEQSELDAKIAAHIAAHDKEYMWVTEREWAIADMTAAAAEAAAKKKAGYFEASTMVEVNEMRRVNDQVAALREKSIAITARLQQEAADQGIFVSAKELAARVAAEMALTAVVVEQRGREGGIGRH